MKLFNLGRTVITASAQHICEEKSINVSSLVLRHQSGDFGTNGNYATTKLTAKELKGGAMETSDDDKLNKWGIDTGKGRIMSVYKEKGATIWIITEHDRSSTTILLPEDY